MAENINLDETNNNNGNNLMKLNIYSRYGLHDRMNDGFVEVPNRRAWSFNHLYNDWMSNGYFNVLDKGLLEVSYDNAAYIPFDLSENKYNRHQVISLSCFLDSVYNSVMVECPHEGGGIFSAHFTRLENNEAVYITKDFTTVRFRFNPNQPSQF